jgi:RNA polymerase sigma factor (sigma-70 family)
MADRHLQTLVRHIRHMAGDLSDAEPSDQVLLNRFLAQRDEAAFAVLVERHGPMVRGVCRRLLGKSPEVDDAFQATFLILICKARSIRKAGSLASWLHGVAHRVALGIRTSLGRRRALERQSTRPTPHDPGLEAAWRELCTLLDEEVQRLAQRYRAPLVLCYLEGQTRDQAARQLGWSLRTLDRRLTRGRELLRLRLLRRGLTLSAGLLAGALGEQAACAAVPVTLLDTTRKAAMLVAAGKRVAAAASSPVAVLVQEGMRAMLWTKLQTATVVVVALAGMVGTGVFLSAAGTPSQNNALGEKNSIEDAAPASAVVDDFDQGDVQPARQSGEQRDLAKERRRSMHNLKQLSLAMHAFHDKFGHFPPPAIYEGQQGTRLSPANVPPGIGKYHAGWRTNGGGGPPSMAARGTEADATGPPANVMAASPGFTGRALLSWRVALLPFLEQEALFKEFHLNEPWDSPHNKKLLARMPNVYGPIAGKQQPDSTYYQVFVGPGAAFEKRRATRMVDIEDGTSNTIMIIEAGRPVPWTKPEDLPFDQDEPLPELGGAFRDGFCAALCDGSARWIPRNVEEAWLRAAITRAGGEVVDERLVGSRAPKDTTLPGQVVRRPGTSDSSPTRDGNDALKENQRLKQEYAELRDSLEQLKAEVKRAADTDVMDRRLREENRPLSEAIQKLKKEAQALTDHLRQLKQDSGGGAERKKY